MSDVMKSAEEQLAEVLELISEQSKLNPTGKAFVVNTDIFSNCPNYKPILEKLAQEHKVIRINQRPDERELSKPDHSMFEDEHPAEYADYMSYHIALMPSFASFYEQRYESSVLGLDKLDGTTLLQVFDLMLDINDKLSLTASKTVKVHLVPSMIRWQVLLPNDTVRNRNIYCDGRMDAAEFLKTIKVLSSVEVPVKDNWDSILAITVTNRKAFDLAFKQAQRRYATYFGKNKTKKEDEKKTEVASSMNTSTNPSSSHMKADAPAEGAIVESDDFYKLLPEHYDKVKGVLHLSPTLKIIIAKRGKARKRGNEKYFECRVLECVFKTVNSQMSGVNFSTILSLHTNKIGNTEKRKVRNAVDSINTKIVNANGQKNLLKIQANKVFVNNSYL